MSEQPDASGLLSEVEQLRVEATEYFERVAHAVSDVAHVPSWEQKRDRFWLQLPPQLQAEATALVQRLTALAGRIAAATQNAALASEADQRDVMTGTKAMRAAVLLRHFRYWDTEVLHDEGNVLGVQRAGQSDDDPCPPDEARAAFAEWVAKIAAIQELVVASHGMTTSESTHSSAARYRPNTAFVMMPMDPSQRDLDDVYDTVKQAFDEFEIAAVRADDIEHEELITDRIRNEIRTAEFLYADLTGARPNVYYEVGYAHALGKRVILYRRAGTNLHFDLAGYNCPEYANLRDLRDKLGKRLEDATNRRRRDPSGPVTARRRS